MAKTTERPSVRSGRPRRPPLWLWIAGLVVAIALVAVVYAMRSHDTALGPVANDPGVTHIHGLGINSANGDVYAATHMGVFRITEDGEATRIADRYQDTMGFTVAGPDHFIASGHPDLREELPPLLGLIESKDGAKTWEKKSLLGKSDFHALRYAHETIYGYDSTGSAFMVSRDGRRWDTRSNTTLRDFVVSPEDPDVIMATAPSGLERSKDGGRTWKEIDGPPEPVLLAWERVDELWMVDFAGGVHRSDDGGRSWESRGKLAPRPEALVAADDRLYMAVDGGIHVSADGGREWKPFYREGDGH